MYEIINFENGNVVVGGIDGSIETYPLTAISYENPNVGDKVKVFKNESMVVITLNATAVQQGTQNQNQAYVAKEKSLNKHVFVWVGAFLFGALGVDRFMRGQVGLGILKIVLFGGLFIWTLVDWIVAMVKAYGSAFGKDENVVFINGKYAR